MSVTGTWKNSYGSLMKLTQSQDGKVTGTYSSTTGSTGVYLVAGFADPVTPEPPQGQSLSLAIFWRSIQGEDADPSWHWVSGLGGQRVTPSPDSPATLNLIHAMVATTDFPGVASVGTYLDKLVYLPAPPSAQETLPEARDAGPARSGDPIAGTWICQQDPGVVLTLQVLDAKLGTVAGSLKMDGDKHEVLGFTDTYAVQDPGVTLQSLSVCAFLASAGQTLALAGSLDLRDGALALTRLASAGTPPGSTYVQTTVAALTFRKPSD